MSGRKLIAVGCVVAAGLALGASALPANAQCYSYYYPAPAYVAPAPVYVAPPPVVYTPPAVVYPAPVYRTYSVYRSYPAYRHYYYPRHRSFSFGFGYSRW